MFYKWNLEILETGEILCGSRFYKRKSNARKYLHDYIVNHYVKPYDDRRNSIVIISIEDIA